MTLARVTAGAAVAVLIVGVALALPSGEPRLAGTNDLRAFHPILLPAESTLCQGPELVPADSARLRVFTSGTHGAGPPLDVELRDGGRVLGSGRAAEGYGDGGVVSEIGRIEDTRVVEEVCVENLADRPVALSGQPVPSDQVAQVNGRPEEARVRLEWVRSGSESWLDLAPAVLHRFGLGKADWLGSWTLFLAVLLVLLTWIAGLRLVLRRDGP
ncbi:MAG: hypothetical protein WD844_10935 [Thermoleophilaceae bacterium]